MGLSSRLRLCRRTSAAVRTDVPAPLVKASRLLRLDLDDCHDEVPAPVLQRRGGQGDRRVSLVVSTGRASAPPPIQDAAALCLSGLPERVGTVAVTTSSKVLLQVTIQFDADDHLPRVALLHLLRAANTP